MIKRAKLLDVLLVFFLVIVSLYFCQPFFNQEIIATDDGEWAIVRLAEMVRELKDFQFPPRWSQFLNHGFGYPLFNFVYPFPYYLGSFLKFIGFGYVASIKALFVSSIVLSGITMFFFTRNFSQGLSSFIASLFYVIAPYRMTDLYNRGSLGESLSFVFFPLIFHFTVLMLKKPSSVLRLFLVLSLSGLLLTHNIMALLFIPVWLSFTLFALKAENRLEMGQIKKFLSVFLLSLSLSAFFVLPALIEKKYIYLSVKSLADRSLYYLGLNEILGIKQTFEYPSFILGWQNLAVFMLSFLSVLIFPAGKKSQKLKYFFFFSGCLVFFIFMTLKGSNFLWQLPLLKEVDFPWRVMGLVVFFSALVTTFLVNNILIAGSVILVMLAVMDNSNYLTNLNFKKNSDSYYYTNDATTTSADELTPVWVKNKPENRFEQKVELLSGDADIRGVSYDSKSIMFGVDIIRDSRLKINTIYFPGWDFTANNKKLQIFYDNPEGLVTFSLPKGQYRLEGKFSETPIRLFSDSLSFITAFYLIIGYLSKAKRND